MPDDFPLCSSSYKHLVEEHGYTGSYSIVRRYMKKCRSIQTEKAKPELIWDHEPAQVDFGEADFYETGKLCRKKYLTVSFPYSNDEFFQEVNDYMQWYCHDCIKQYSEG